MRIIAEAGDVADLREIVFVRKGEVMCEANACRQLCAGGGWREENSGFQVRMALGLSMDGEDSSWDIKQKKCDHMDNSSQA